MYIHVDCFIFADNCGLMILQKKKRKTSEHLEFQVKK